MPASGILKSLTVASLLMTSAAMVYADGLSKQTLAVKGLISPGSCKPTLANDGVYDYGNVEAAQDTVVQLVEKSLVLSIDCDAKVQVAFTAMDNKPSSIGPTAAVGYEIYSLGLGFAPDGKTPLGALRISPVAPITVDGVNTSMIRYRDGQWMATLSRNIEFVKNETFTWAQIRSAPLSPVPATFKNAVMGLWFDVRLEPKSKLPTGVALPFEGNVTLQMSYL
jgi:hypothetical protein